MRTMKRWAAVAAMLAVSGVAQAALVLQSNGVEVLDTDTNLLWLHDWNSSGRMAWDDAQAWTSGLTVGGAAAGAWRLPEMSEIEDLWAEVGSSLAGLRNHFSGVQTFLYWSSTDSSLNSNASLAFNPYYGEVSHNSRGSEFFAVAVRANDAPAAVPEPQSLALALTALGAVLVVGRRRPR